MEQVFPDEIVALFAVRRATTLALRCTCKKFAALIAATPWPVTVTFECEDYDGYEYSTTFSNIYGYNIFDMARQLSGMNAFDIDLVEIHSDGIRVLGLTGYRTNKTKHARVFARECYLAGTDTQVVVDIPGGLPNIRKIVELVPRSTEIVVEHALTRSRLIVMYTTDIVECGLLG